MFPSAVTTKFFLADFLVVFALVGLKCSTLQEGQSSKVGGGVVGLTTFFISSNKGGHGLGSGGLDSVSPTVVKTNKCDINNDLQLLYERSNKYCSQFVRFKHLHTFWLFGLFFFFVVEEHFPRLKLLAISGLKIEKQSN